jgi:predicted dinucleotide-binding enzyme
MKPGRQKLARTASSATNPRAVAAAEVVVIKTRAVAAAVISGEIAEIEILISRTKRSAMMAVSSLTADSFRDRSTAIDTLSTFSEFRSQELQEFRS